MDPLLSDLISALGETPRPVDRDRIISAWEFADLAHTGQKRHSGEPFIIHPTAVAKTLALWNMDTTTIVAGLLHDTIEDGGATREDLVQKFGEDVANIVDGVTNITNIRLTASRDEQFVENLRKMLLVMAKDLRVIMVKLADRLHNTRTLEFLPPESQVANARETLEIYAPLAERLGMGHVKSELEDLSFPFLYPQEYKDLLKKIKNQYALDEIYVAKFREELLNLLHRELPRAEANLRLKHKYSLFRKLQRPEKNGDLSKIYDLIAARVLVDSVGECYLALGLIHGTYHPVPFLGVRDFIANPKPNGYQSIHTNVFGPEGKIVEIQIRTHAMHEVAEMGVAAHWHYSSVKSTGVSGERLDKGFFTPEKKLTWVRQLASWQDEMADNSEYMAALKFDALAQRNLVFSPVGDVYDLPRGATPVDYAYAVHTDLGHQVSGAKVNGRLVGLDHKLDNGDVVEIIVDRKRTRPNPDWLDFVVTTAARREISKTIKN